VDIIIENVEKLGYEQISSEPIREAAAGLDAAKAACLSARRDLVELEQTREAAEWRDAEAADKARAEGKAEPKRSHVAAHDRKTDEARHEHKVATLAEARALDALQSALDEHGQTWVESIDAELAKLDDAWTEQVRELVALHAKRSAVIATKSKVCGPTGRSGALRFVPSAIQGLDWASGTNDRQTGYVEAGSVFSALSELGLAAPVVEKEPQQHRPPLSRSPLLDHGDVQREHAERREFAERTSSPERVAERQKRSEQLRAQNAAAEQAEVG
jgi:hypothetical protein